MPRKSYKPEEIVAKLRQVDVLTSQGQSVGEAIRSIWRREGLKVPARQPKRARLWLNDGSCDSHSGHTAEPTRRCRPSVALRPRGPAGSCAGSSDTAVLPTAMGCATRVI